MGRPPEEGWLDDIEVALREIFTTEAEEDEAFDNATRALDALRPFVLAQGRVIEAARAFLACGPDYGGQSTDDFAAYCARFDAAYDELKAALAAGGETETP